MAPSAGPIAPSAGPWGARLRTFTGVVGALFLAGVVLVAGLLLLVDGWHVVGHVDSLASVRVALVAGVAILVGAAWLLGVTWVAGRSPRATTFAIVAGVATLVVIRLVIMLVYDGELNGEPAIYDRYAARLAEGTFPWDRAFERPPGYMAVLGGAYALVGRSVATMEWLNLLFALATGLIVLDLGRRLGGARVGAAALMLYALWPAGALMVVVALPHTAYDLAIAAAAWALVVGPTGWRGSAAVGLLLGLSQYLRPTTLFLLPVFLVARAWGGDGEGARGRVAAFLRGVLVPMVLAFVLVLVPVAAWHMSERGVVDITTSAYGGYSLYHGTNPESGGAWSRAAADTLEEIGGPTLWSASRMGQQLALERIREDPLGVAVLAVRKQVRFWGRETYGVRYGIRRDLASRPWLPRSVLPSMASGVFWVGLLALTAGGLWVRRRETDALGALLVGTVLLIALMHGLVEVRDRYHSYVVPLMMPVAGYALVRVVERLGGVAGRWRRGPAPEEAEG